MKPTLSGWAILKDWAELLLSYASGGPTVVLALWYILTGREQQKIGFLAFLGVCSIVAAWVGLYRERKMRVLERERQKPSLRVGAGDFHRFNGTFIDQFGNPMPYPFTSLRLRVENDPETGTEISQAVDVAAKVTFMSETKDRTFRRQVERHRSAIHSFFTANGGRVEDRQHFDRDHAHSRSCA